MGGRLTSFVSHGNLVVYRRQRLFLKFSKYYFTNYMHAYLSVWGYAHVSARAHGDQKWALDILELKLQGGCELSNVCTRNSGPLQEGYSLHH